jgi:hypothetical protein
MANENNTVVLRGKVNFFRMLPDQLKLNYNKDGKEWVTDFYGFPIKEVKALGIGDRVKQKDGYLDGEPFLTFKQAELRRDGETRNNPVKVTDILNKDWDPSKQIGNGSTCDVKFAVIDYGKGKKKGVYIRSVRVLDHIPYEGASAFEPINETDEFFAAAQAAAEASKNAPKTVLEDLDQSKTDAPFDFEDDVELAV